MWVAILEQLLHVIKSEDKARDVSFLTILCQLDERVSEAFVLIVDALMLDRHVAFAVA